jgi:hypothetical protein
MAWNTEFRCPGQLSASRVIEIELPNFLYFAQSMRLLESRKNSKTIIAHLAEPHIHPHFQKWLNRGS